MTTRKNQQVSLTEFAKTNTLRTGIASWCDSLPDDIKEQLINADVSATVAFEWLQRQGFTGGTVQRVYTWRRNVRRERGWRSES